MLKPLTSTLSALAYMPTLIRHRLWPDPHRFYPPDTRPRPSLVSHFLNQSKLKQHGVACAVRFQNVAALHQLCANTQPGHPSIIVPSHSGFTDPHSLMAFPLTYPDKPFFFMAGTEAFEKNLGFNAWLIQRHGTFSVDRGSVDKHSLATTNQILAEGRYPLVLFAEGEANYSEDVRLPFQQGAAQLGLKALKKPSVETLTYLPIAIRYPLSYRHPDRFQRQYQLTLEQWQLAYNRPIECRWSLSRPMAEQAHHLMEEAVTFMWHHYLPKSPMPSGFTQQCHTLIEHLLTTLCNAHDVTLNPEALTDITAAMALKNKLRSQINKKIRSLPPKWLAKHQKRVSQWQYIIDNPETEPPLTDLDRWQMTQLERALTGLDSSGTDLGQRLNALAATLEKRQPASEQWAKLPKATQNEWIAHLDVCRQVKLLHILVMDYPRELDTPEQWDETRLKCHLMLTHRFQFTGPKEAVVIVGEPITYGADEANLPSADALTQTLQEKVEALLAERPATLD